MISGRKQSAILDMVKNLFHSTIGFFGIRIVQLSKFNKLVSDSIEADWLLKRYKEAVQEFHDCILESVFPEIPYCEGRKELMSNVGGLSLSEAIYILKFLYKSLNLEGDVCEFGIAGGRTSVFLANEIKNTGKNLWLFDSFEGLSEPTEKDILLNDIMGLGSMNKYKGKITHSQYEVEERLKKIDFPLSRTKIVAGLIEESIKRVDLPHKVSFAFVDFDFYQPTLTTLAYLHETLSLGGFIIVDDYGFFSSGAKTAVDEFMVAHNHSYELIDLPKFAQTAKKFCIIHKK